MAFESMENSSQTALPISKIIVDEALPHGLTASISSRQEAFGSSQTLIAGASTAGTLARFLPQSFNIDCAPYGRFAQTFPCHSLFLPVIAVIISAVAWSGHLVTIPFALLAPLLLYHAQSRLHSYATMFSYYLGASWPAIPGASTFFGARGSIIEGIAIWLASSERLRFFHALVAFQCRLRQPSRLSHSLQTDSIERRLLRWDGKRLTLNSEEQAKAIRISLLNSPRMRRCRKLLADQGRAFCYFQNTS